MSTLIPSRLAALNNLFTSRPVDDFSLPAQKPASVSGDSGAGLVGNSPYFKPFCLQFRKPAGFWVRSCFDSVLAVHDRAVRLS